MNHFLELLKVQLANGFVSGGLVLMMTGSIVAMARNLPMRIWARIKDQFVVSVQVTNRDVLFDWLSLWLNDQPYSKRTRRLIATTTSPYSMGQCTPSVVGEGDGEPTRPLLVFSPAAGMHFFVYHGKLLWLSRDDNSQDYHLDARSCQVTNLGHLALKGIVSCLWIYGRTFTGQFYCGGTFCRGFWSPLLPSEVSC